MALRNTLQIYFITNKQREEYETLSENWRAYFNIKTYYISEKNAASLIGKKVDFLFIDNDIKKDTITWEYLNEIREFNPYFKNVWFHDIFFKDRTYEFLKYGADDIIYFESEFEYMKWKTIALLRRRWETHSNDNVVFHRGLIVNNVNNECFLNDKHIELSKKEFQVLKVIVEAEPDEFVQRQYIYKKVWKHDDNDPTRVVQQIIQNLKRKIGKDYFEIVRNKGIKLA
ncbi:MAG: response regulator transcription factor [Mycoplasmatales bacterium]|nr:response regulator transcription factor [Mycoplasmatales bacterium]